MIDDSEKPITQEWGDIGVSNEVFESIAVICARKVSGVVGLESAEGLVDSLSKVWGRGDTAKGVKVVTGEEDIAIDMTVVLKEGFPIPQVAGQIQREVKSAVEEMTGHTVKGVNILVADVQPDAREAELLPPTDVSND